MNDRITEHGGIRPDFDEVEWCEHGVDGFCAQCEPLPAPGNPPVTELGRYVRSNMGLVHAVAPSGQRAVCGSTLKESWEPAEVADWASEPNVCRSCDDVLMSRGRRAAP